MTTYRILAAASLALALAACSGQQQADGTAAQTAPAPGEMPQAGETATATGSPVGDMPGTDTSATGSVPATTSADAGAMGEGGMDHPIDPTTGEPLKDPLEHVDPAIDGSTSDQEQSATPPPPTQ